MWWGRGKKKKPSLPRWWLPKIWESDSPPFCFRGWSDSLGPNWKTVPQGHLQCKGPHRGLRLGNSWWQHGLLGNTQTLELKKKNWVWVPALTPTSLVTSATFLLLYWLNWRLRENYTFFIWWYEYNWDVSCKRILENAKCCKMLIPFTYIKFIANDFSENRFLLWTELISPFLYPTPP